MQCKWRDAHGVYMLWSTDILQSMILALPGYHDAGMAWHGLTAYEGGNSRAEVASHDAVPYAVVLPGGG